MNNHNIHSFHIPVMGLAYTIDSPVKVARFGINSVVSIIEDRLIEMMRKFYYEKYHLNFQPIRTNEPSYRSRRITDYLNLLQTIIKEQVENLKDLPFTKGTEIVKYFEMLPPGSVLKKLYEQYLQCTNAEEKLIIEKKLRNNIRPGSIDVNIMTKTDKDNYAKDGTLVPNGSDAVSALAGFAESNLKNSSVIFSAGMNPRLFNYLAKLHVFDPDEDGNFQKKVIIKVSDFRSALIQGMFLAKKGVWVSEFRIESGLNCGGHAFATTGKLIGPILKEFKDRRAELLQTTFNEYNKALLSKAGRCFKYPPIQKISIQGGLGTNEERELLHTKYDVDGTGWGTPFLLVPEATTVDKNTLARLMAAKEKDVVLSDVSPLGVKFYYLKDHSGGKEKLDRILSGKPGSPCTEKHLAFNTEFASEPICTASIKYQSLKLKQLDALELETTELNRQRNEVLAKECICVGLSNPAAQLYDIDFIKTIKGVTVCPGPNIAWFNKEVSLQNMVDHIYGRKNIMESTTRPHVFINELNLYLKYLENEIIANPEASNTGKEKYFSEFFGNLETGIKYYFNLKEKEINDRKQFNAQLIYAEDRLYRLMNLFKEKTKTFSLMES